MAAEAEEPADHARDYAGIAEAYARDVVSGHIVACRFVKFACNRHLRDLERAEAGWDYRFDEWHANDVCDFIEKLEHVEGVWETPEIRLEPAQIFILAVIFGWRRVDDGFRRFSSVYIEMARKGAKSTLTAGVALYCLCCEGEVGPQILIGATTGAQALKVFAPAQGMVRKSPDLQEAFSVKAWSKSITCGDNGGFIQPINSKGSTQDGHNPHLGILDELHAHKDRALYDVIKSAFGARKNPLLWVITTAGYNTNGVCYEQRIYVAKVLEGVFEADHYFGIIFTIDDEIVDDEGNVVCPADDPFDERVWIKANPMLGVTPTLAGLRAYAADAKASPASEGEFKTKRLNVWLNAASAWLNVESWKRCGDPALSWDDFDGLDCMIGGDLADKDDICALVLAAFDKEGRLIFKPKFWLPEVVLADPTHAEGRGPAPYRTWSRGEDPPLILTPGDWVDFGEIEKTVRAWRERYGAKTCRFDQFAAAQALASRLNEDLATPDDPFAAILHKSAANVTDPAKELARRVKAGPRYIRHDGNPVMTWMASNVCVARRRDETILPIKESPMSPNKIDGIDALINAIAPAIAVTPTDDTVGKGFVEV